MRHPRRRTRSTTLTVAFALFAGLHPVRADEVLISNGDRLSGDVLRQEKGQLRLKTTYAGTVEIAWKDVREAHFDRPKKVWKERLQIYHRQVDFAAASDSNKQLWRSWTGVRVPLVAGFVASVEYEIDNDSQPAVDALTTDETFNLKLGYKW